MVFSYRNKTAYGNNTNFFKHMTYFYKKLYVCDYFTICSGSSNTQVNAITGSIQKLVSKELKDKPWHVEGQNNSEWILMDYVNVVVHVFQKHIREFYDIESLWGDAKITVINPV